MKRIIFIVFQMIAILSIFFVFGIGKQLGAYTWGVAVFIAAPIAIIALFIQIIILIIFLCKRKNVLWNMLYILISIIFALPFTVLLGISPIVYPTNADASSTVNIAMPIENAVVFGGPEYKVHAMWPSECYAYDILKEPYNIGSHNLEDYGIYDCDVFAPISGTITSICNNEPDIEPNTDKFSSSLGNYICIRIEYTGTYLILAHLKQGSILVKENDHIEKGQIIGKVGNSGTTSEPHLHIQHQENNPADVIFPPFAYGLPISFENN